MRDADEFGEEGGEALRGEASLEEMHTVVDCDLVLELWVDVGRDGVFYFEDDVLALIELFLYYEIGFGLDVVIALFLFYHLQFLHLLFLTVFSLLSLLLRVFKS